MCRRRSTHRVCLPGSLRGRKDSVHVVEEHGSKSKLKDSNRLPTWDMDPPVPFSFFRSGRSFLIGAYRRRRRRRHRRRPDVNSETITTPNPIKEEEGERKRLVVIYCNSSSSSSRCYEQKKRSSSSSRFCFPKRRNEDEVSQNVQRLVVLLFF